MEIDNSLTAVENSDATSNAIMNGLDSNDLNSESNTSELVHHPDEVGIEASKEAEIIEENTVGKNEKTHRARIVVPSTTFNPIISPNGNGNIRSRIAEIRKDFSSSRDLESQGKPAVVGNVGRSASSNRRAEIEHMKELRRQEEEAQFTYFPKTVTKKKFESKMEFFEDRFLILYGDAKKCHLTQRTERLRELLEEELTFSPKLSPRVRSVSRDAKNRKDFETRLHNISLTASKERMITSRNDSSDIANINIAKAKAAGKITVDECTFSPKITSRAKSMERVRGTHLSDSSVMSVNERLYQQGAQLKEKQEKRKAEAEKYMYEECTFTPQLASSRATSPRAASPRPSSPPKGGKARKEYLSTSLPERLMKYEKYRTDRLQAAVREKEEKELQAATFQPQLVAKHSSTGEIIGQQLPVHERLAIVPGRQRLNEIEAAVYADVTFQPQLIASTKRPTSPTTLRARDRSPKPDRQNMTDVSKGPEENGEEHQELDIM